MVTAFLSCVELKLGVLLDVRYALTALLADGTATWKTYHLSKTHQNGALAT